MPEQLTGISPLVRSLLQNAEASYPDQTHRVWEVWERAVGPEVAKRTSPISLRRGTLLVAVATAPWMQQLSFLRENIRDSVNRTLGRDLVREVRFLLGEVERGKPSRGAPAPPTWLTKPIDAATLA